MVPSNTVDAMLDIEVARLGFTSMWDDALLTACADGCDSDRIDVGASCRAFTLELLSGDLDSKWSCGSDLRRI